MVCGFCDLFIWSLIQLGQSALLMRLDYTKAFGGMEYFMLHMKRMKGLNTY